jgi:hypothetical protein
MVHRVYTRDLLFKEFGFTERHTKGLFMVCCAEGSDTGKKLYYHLKALSLAGCVKNVKCLRSQHRLWRKLPKES